MQPAPFVQRRLEDPLAHLPRTTITEYGRKQIVYNQQQPSTSIYLVTEGKIKVSRLSDSGQEIMMDIYQSEEFFGEAAFLGLPHRQELAVALGKAKLMEWSMKEIEDNIMKNPHLGTALLQVLAQRELDFEKRVESFSLESICQRLARALVRFSERFGTRQEDGSVCMDPFSHEILSRFIGTSREIVTLYMNRFRRQGFIRYSRKSIILYPEALKQMPKQG